MGPINYEITGRLGGARLLLPLPLYGPLCVQPNRVGQDWSRPPRGNERAEPRFLTLVAWNFLLRPKIQREPRSGVIHHCAPRVASMRRRVFPFRWPLVGRQDTWYARQAACLFELLRSGLVVCGSPSKVIWSSKGAPVWKWTWTLDWARTRKLASRFVPAIIGGAPLDWLEPACWAELAGWTPFPHHFNQGRQTRTNQLLAGRLQWSRPLLAGNGLVLKPMFAHQRPSRLARMFALASFGGPLIVSLFAP